MYRIRLVNASEKRAWTALRKKLWPKVRFGDLHAETQDLYRTRSKTPTFVAVAAHNQLVGFIELSIHKNVEVCETQDIGYIEGWYVLPEFQRKGIGLALLQRGEQWAIEQGCREMASDTDDDYPHSIAAHEKAGFQTIKTEIVYFKKWLGVDTNL